MESDIPSVFFLPMSRDVPDMPFCMPSLRELLLGPSIANRYAIALWSSDTRLPS